MLFLFKRSSKERRAGERKRKGGGGGERRIASTSRGGERPTDASPRAASLNKGGREEVSSTTEEGKECGAPDSPWRGVCGTSITTEREESERQRKVFLSCGSLVNKEVAERGTSFLLLFSVVLTM